MELEKPDINQLTGLPTVHEAYLADDAPGGIQCGLCRQRCLISPGETGFCNTRINIDGKLYTMTYGDIVACESRPVEIKPLFHFLPGESLLTFCCASCNLRCPWCQNHRLSRARPRPLKARHVPMKEMVGAARSAGDAGFCVSYTEPTMLFEYCLGLFRECWGKEMAAAFVSNGYMTTDAIHMLARAGMNAISIDIKGSDAVYRDKCGAREGDRPPWESVRHALEMGVHVEVVHLVVTGLNDDPGSFEDVCRDHLEYAGAEVPLHITAYIPAHEYHEPPTPVEFLEEAHRVARDAGILFPYLGNVPGHPLESTWCPECGQLCLERSGHSLKRDLTERNACPSCGYEIPIVRDCAR